MINKLLEWGVGKVLLTRESKGVTLYSRQQKKDYSTLEVKPVDTTAAGDAFAVGFVYELN